MATNVLRHGKEQKIVDSVSRQFSNRRRQRPLLSRGLPFHDGASLTPRFQCHGLSHQDARYTVISIPAMLGGGYASELIQGMRRAKAKNTNARKPLDCGL